MSDRSPESRRGRRLSALERRVEFLRGRVANYTGASDSRDKAELSALCWALGVIRAAVTVGSLDELERVALGPELPEAPKRRLRSLHEIERMHADAQASSSDWAPALHWVLNPSPSQSTTEER